MPNRSLWIVSETVVYRVPRMPGRLLAPGLGQGDRGVVELLSTQSLVIFAIRTHRVPFSPLAGTLGFTALPATFLTARPALSQFTQQRAKVLGLGNHERRVREVEDRLLRLGMQSLSVLRTALVLLMNDGNHIAQTARALPEALCGRLLHPAPTAPR